jgi:predicted AlkP superfamily phosphohydrolase/phosphomutase
VHWGAHDPGTAPQCRPDSLAQEIEARFGAYPATPFIYGFVWPDAARTRAMAEALVRAVDVRTAISRWLFTERLPEWDLALLVVSEFHSALEALWHGIDPSHPLHALPSAAPARDGVHGVYEALDRLVGTLEASFPDARIVLFSMHGMGPNQSDVPSMLLLPELVLRAQLGRSCFVPRPEWVAAPDGVPRLGPREEWSRAVHSCVGRDEAERKALRVKARAMWQRLDPSRNRQAPYAVDVGWVPAARYQPFWEQMDAFALPSFYDGRIRINLVGRERKGRVALRDYAARCDELTRLLEVCRDPRTGEPVVAQVERPVQDDPLAAAPTQADLVVLWRGAPLAFAHPQLGVIGPAPYRRTGGHTGGRGIGYLAAEEIVPGDYGVRSSFDVVPTLLELCGVEARGLSGESLLPGCAPARGERAQPSAAGGAR